MKENIVIVRKAVSSDSPTEWERVGPHRRACIARMTVNEAAKKSEAFAEQGFLATHTVWVDKSADFEIGRMIINTRDNMNYRILFTQEAGKRTPAGYREMILTVTEIPQTIEYS